MQKKGILVLFLFIFSLTFIQAQPPFPPTLLDTGVAIDFPQINVLKVDEDFTFNFHASNITSGKRYDNNSAWCIFELFNSSGFHIISELNMSWEEPGRDWELTVSKGNFTKREIMYYLVYCETYSGDGGTVLVGFETTPTGMIIEQAESTVYLILAFGVLLMFIISFYFMITTPYENETNQKGAVIKITKLKYVKLGLILLTWVLFTWFLNILIGLSDGFVTLTMYYGFFGFIFQVMNNLALWLGLVILVIAFFEIIRDANLYENIKKLGSALQ